MKPSVFFNLNITIISILRGDVSVVSNILYSFSIHFYREMREMSSKEEEKNE